MFQLAPRSSQANPSSSSFRSAVFEYIPLVFTRRVIPLFLASGRTLLITFLEISTLPPLAPNKMTYFTERDCASFILEMISSSAFTERAADAISHPELSAATAIPFSLKSLIVAVILYLWNGPPSCE